MLSHINKNNLHHAYLIEGNKNILEDILSYFNTELKFNTKSNPDFYFKSYDTFRIDDARELNKIKDEKSFSGEKRSVLIFANSILREAQNSMLKMFEEPIENTHFFLVIRDKNTLIPTFISRFYFITNTNSDLIYSKEAKNFLKMNLKERIDFIKVFTEKGDEEDPDYIAPRHKSLQFLDALEVEFSKNKKDKDYAKKLNQIFEIRSYLRDPSSSAKTLLEALALNL